MSKRVIVYTAIFGDYSGLIPQPKLPNVEYICYTDRDIKCKNWTIVKVKAPFSNDNTRSNRWYKILPHKHLPEDCDISVYIDGNIWILKDINSLIEEKMNLAKMASFDHNQNSGDKRDCIYLEYEALMEDGKEDGVYRDDPEIMTKQIKRFKQEGYPENNGLITAPILIRKHFDNEVIKVMEAWWNIVNTESKRDQLSFNYVAWKLNFINFTYINGSVRSGNPWFYTISHRKKYAFKMFKIKFKKFFKPKNN